MSEIQPTYSYAPFGKLAKVIVGLTGVLLVVPALINSGVDVYKAVMKIPGSEAERTNQSLFKRHFGKSPLASAEVPVKTEVGNVSMQFQVYEGGDVYVRYGSSSQWFASPLREEPLAAARYPRLIASAHAQSLQWRAPTDPRARLDIYEDGKLKREWYLEDGKKWTFEIDPLTGKWQAPTVTPYEKIPQGAIQVTPKYIFPELDLTDPKKSWGGGNMRRRP
ncbi:MAG: hypothetical protein GKR94_07720 [Gammaproteobacteria bacterium]|nr:hypothetical protein [Gammaproteobacteria bacterium]